MNDDINKILKRLDSIDDKITKFLLDIEIFKSTFLEVVQMMEEEDMQENTQPSTLEEK